MKAALSFISITILLTACTYYRPCSFSVTNTYPNNTVLISNVTATSKIVYILGIGKIRKRVPIAQQAKNKLLSTYKLKPYQSLTNITLDYTTTNWFFWYTDRAIINADVIQFLKPGEAYIPNDSLFIIGTKEVNGKRVNLYSNRFNYKLGEEIKVMGVNPALTSKIIELYDEEVLTEYYKRDFDYSDYILSSKTFPYSQISKKHP